VAWKLAGVLVTLCGLCATAAITLLLGRDFVTTYRAQAWPQSLCEITDSHVVPGDDEASKVRVSWRYEAKGQSYEIVNEDPAVFGIVLNQEEARAAVRRYPVRARVPCFYDPENPIQSTLDRRKPPSEAIVSFAAIPMLMILGSFATGAFLYTRRKRA
jgi:hypothetical protein